MFKKGQLVKTKRGGQYVIVLQDEDNIVERKKPGFALRDNLELLNSIRWRTESLIHNGIES